MGVKGLSKAVIKRVWRDSNFVALPPGTRIGVDAAGWLHEGVPVANASDTFICQSRKCKTPRCTYIV